MASADKKASILATEMRTGTRQLGERRKFNASLQGGARRRTIFCGERNRKTIQALLAKLDPVPELTSASYLTFADVRKIRRNKLSVDVFGTVHGHGIERLTAKHTNIVGDGEVSAEQVGYFTAGDDGLAQLTSAGEVFVKCGLKTARLIHELKAEVAKQSKQAEARWFRETPQKDIAAWLKTINPPVVFPEELDEFPADPAWDLGVPKHRGMPRFFRDFAGLADMDAKACKGGIVRQTATHVPSGHIYTLLYTDTERCDGGNTAGLILRGRAFKKKNVVRIIHDSTIEAVA